MGDFKDSIDIESEMFKINWHGRTPKLSLEYDQLNINPNQDQTGSDEFTFRFENCDSSSSGEYYVSLSHYFLQ